MTQRAKIVAAVAGVLLLSVGAFFLISNRDDIPIVGGLVDDEPTICPLTGIEPAREARALRPAVAVKIENASIAYPLSGLDQAEIVFEEPVEGGATRFMALYHCSDAVKAGPVRSARVVDPAIMMPWTRILAFSGANATVLAALEDAGVVTIQESTAGAAMQRIPRAGLAVEHTLYADTAALRKLGKKSNSEPPPQETLKFGDLQVAGRKASTITLDFGGSNNIVYTWSPSGWLRSENGAPFEIEGSGQLAVDNVMIQRHEVRYSKTIKDPAGNPSVEIADVTGTGKAVLFRDGRAVVGTWSRDSVESGVIFKTKEGEEMIFATGSIWVHLVPSKAGDVKGSFSYAK